VPSLGFAHRPTALGHHGLVASAHPRATLAGLDVLRRGGRAADAAIAVNAVLAVVQPQMCGLGGDLFVLYHDPRSGQVACLDSAGRAGSRASAARLRDQGHPGVPLVGPAGVTVPGCVAGWQALAERFGSRPLGELLGPAIELAAEGFPVSDLVAQTIVERAEVLAHPEWRRIFFPGGRPLRAGDRLRQPDLAGSLQAIARDGPGAFYEGAIGERIVRHLESLGGDLEARDLAAHRPRWPAPLRAAYRGAVVYQTPPPTQGLTVLQALGLLQATDLPALGLASAERIHALVEALRVAYLDRDRLLADPDHLPEAPAALLEPGYLAARRALCRPPGALTTAGAAGPGETVAGDTTGFVVASPDGGVMAVIQSLYSAFGSGVVAPGTGIVLQNRGCGFSLDPGSPNVLAPGKQPFHTLIAALVTRDGAPAAALGQPQTHVQVLTHLLDFGLDPQEAIERPRFVLGRVRPTDRPDRLRVERRVGPAVVSRLRAWGHPVELTPPLSTAMGQAHALAITAGRGPGEPWVVAGGADPRGDGVALGY
jgi:gamma-glutamyltranspeptidase